jgi:cytosine/creatinine deaminase
MSASWFKAARLAGSNQLYDIHCNASKIELIEPHNPARQGHNLAGALVMGALAHWHTHLDKTYTIARAQQTEPGLLGAIKACEQDIQTWTNEDVFSRANTALEESWQAGCRIVRSHINWTAGAEPLAWSVLEELAQQWKGRIELQRVALVKSELFDDAATSDAIARGIKNRNGMLGAFVHSINATAARIESLVQRSRQYELAMDIHLDEEINPHANGLKFLLTSLGTAEHAPITVSHVCALAVKPVDERNALIDGLAKAGIDVIALPATNLYLQDQSEPTQPLTPSLRGIAPVHELKRAGVTVRLSCDNVQDPFYPWGSYDPIDLMHIAAPALQLVSCFDQWSGATACNAIAVGQPSNMTIFPEQSAASWPAQSKIQLTSQPPARQLVRNGQLV